MGVSSRKVRVIFEVSKRVCKDIIDNAVGNAPSLIQQKHSAAIIQHWFRRVWAAHLSRQALLRANRTAREKAAIKQIQSCYRSHQEKKREKQVELGRRETASTVISSTMRWKLAVLRVEKMRQERIHEHRCSMTIIIQCFLRVSVAKNRMFQRKDGAERATKASGVLQIFFKEILSRRAERRKLENQCATIIQMQALAHANRCNFARMRSAAVSIQKSVRGHQARSITLPNMQFDPAHLSETCHDSPAKQESPPPSPRPTTPTVEPVCDRCGVVAGDELADHHLDKHATIIQLWYRSVHETRVAALLMTRVARRFLAVKKVGEESKQRRVIQKRNQKAATRIQAIMRIRQAKTKTRARCLELVEELKDEVRRDFNDTWMNSFISPAIQRKKMESTVPVVRSRWFRTIPKEAQPPFEFHYAQELDVN
mmetsp:Transcript_20747/g.43317  ORF Transcript_20747/g.43317 Transcript_20747/m.43317 type:complete len:426 (-) Transcript_20747:1735-3012(-)